MLKAIVSNRLSSKSNDEKENLSIHKTPGKKGSKNTIKKKKSQAFGEKKYKLNYQNNDMKNINNAKMSDIKQYSLKTPLKSHQINQRTPLSSLKKTNVTEQNFNSLKKSTIPSKSFTINIKKNINNNTATTNNNNNKNTNSDEKLSIKHKSQNQNKVNLFKKKFLDNEKEKVVIDSDTTTTTEKNFSFSTKKQKIESDSENEGISDSDIEYMPQTEPFKEEEIKPEIEINFEELVKFRNESLIDTKLYQRFYSDIELESPFDSPKSKDFEFVDNFILENTNDKEKKENGKKEEKNENNTNTENKCMNEQNNKIEKEKDDDNILQKMEEINKKLYNYKDEEEEEDEEDENISEPDFCKLNNNSMYFEEIKL